MEKEMRNIKLVIENIYLMGYNEDNIPCCYYPLTKETKELNLPLLPNPFRYVNIEELAEKWYIDNIETSNSSYNDVNSFIEGYKAAQSSNKQYSLEDMKKAIRDSAYTIDPQLLGTDEYSIEENRIIQSLSTQQLPKEFEMEYEPEYWGARNIFNPNSIDFKIFSEKEKEKYIGVMFDYHPKKLKTITNSQGKETLQGNYIW